MKEHLKDNQSKAFELKEIAQLVEENKTLSEHEAYLEKKIAGIKERKKMNEDRLRALDASNSPVQRIRYQSDLVSFKSVSVDSKKERSLKFTIIEVINVYGKVIKKNVLDSLLVGVASPLETKSVIRRMKERKELVSVIYNNSVMFTFIALPQWIENGKLLSDFRPDQNDLPINIISVDLTREKLRHE